MLTRDDNILIGRLMVICTDRNRSLVERFSLAYEVIDTASQEFCFELHAAVRRERRACALKGHLRRFHFWHLETLASAIDLRMAAIAEEGL